MMLVVCVLSIMALSGAAMMDASKVYSQQTAEDDLVRWIDRARTAAVVKNRHAMLVFCPPVGDAGGSGCGIAIKTLDRWPESMDEVIEVASEKRWRFLDSGVVLLGGSVGGAINPLDAPVCRIRETDTHAGVRAVHLIGFHPGGGICYPEGELPLSLSVAEGSYRNGSIQTPPHAGSGGCNRTIRIERNTGRPERVMP